MEAETRTAGRIARLARAVAVLGLLAQATLAQAWWNEEWKFRKDLSIDVTGRVAADAEPLTNFPVLVRLHVGNFAYFGDTAPDGADLRFLAVDDLTVLKHHVENYDPVEFVANVWVQIPRLAPGAPYEFSMYYGNPAAATSSDPDGLFAVDDVLVAHFDGQGSAIDDATAYAHRLIANEDLHTGAALIGGGLDFVGTDGAASGTLAPTVLTGESGFALSAWVRPSQAAAGPLLRLSDGATDYLDVAVEEGSFVVRVSAGGVAGEVASTAVPLPETWQHVGVTASNGELTLLINGVASGSAAIALPTQLETLTLGSDGTTAFSGLVDELRIASAPRSVGYFAAIAAVEGVGSAAVTYGGDQAEGEAGGEGGHPNYFLITMQNVTVDGWIVIVILAVMALASWIIMLIKGLVIGRVRKDNANFLRDFYSRELKDPAALDDADDDEDHSGILDAISGPHDHYQSSTIYHLYHAGIGEVRRRLGSTVGAQSTNKLNSAAVDAIRATVDAKLVRETQRLNSMMVLLTIAIAGGPFLGLLGTVVGVMITFAAIAASGDVNVNAIAPGIAAALAATVAGLAVAIPALFGYNILATRIKEIVADMRVFTDEFITRLAEHYR